MPKACFQHAPEDDGGGELYTSSRRERRPSVHSPPAASKASRNSCQHPKRNREPEGPRDAATQQRIRSPLGGRNCAVVVARIAQHVAASPYGFDVVLTAGGRLQLLAQL